MRTAIITTIIFLCALTVARSKEKAPEAKPAAHAPEQSRTRYRLGKAPKPEFKSGGKSYKIDANAAEAKRVRSLKPEEFDPLRRREHVEEFYRRVFKERFEEYRHRPRLHCGPFRSEFIYWTYDWPIALRARWAWHHRHYFDELLWAE